MTGIGRMPAILVAAGGLMIAAAGCAGIPHHASAKAHVAAGRHAPEGRAPHGSAAAAPAAPADATATRALNFASPQAAMGYLAAAFNADNSAALHEVTTPQAFRQLQAMRSGAVNLRLRSCTLNPRGDYTCQFVHDYPASLHQPGHGAATVIAAPALDPGWYMYTLLDCG
jgi:hypothetical protein